MKFKITQKILSIPPYVSTKWENVLYVSFLEKDGSLLICLKNNDKIYIPKPSPEVCELVFKFYEESANSSDKKGFKELSLLGNAINLRVNPESLGDHFTGIMQHDASQRNAPLLPKEILEKIASVAKALGNKTFHIPESEDNCNCPYCQITRAMHGITDDENEEEEVKDEDLKFKEWEVEYIDNNLYDVTHCEDESKKYRVHLGTPIGCTCGKNNCEHILAVLHT